jgi:hypothetical protein
MAATPCERTAVDPDEWYTTNEVAAFLGCSQWAVLARLKSTPQRIAGRQLPPIGGGSPRWRVPGGEVLRLLGAAALAGRTAAEAREYERANREAMERLGLGTTAKPKRTRR